MMLGFVAAERYILLSIPHLSLGSLRTSALSFSKGMTLMKSLTTTLLQSLLIVFLFASGADSATRYKDIVFGASKSTLGIQFGTNLNLDGTTAVLLADLYEPVNDTSKLRPLVIFIHGGSLIGGSRGEMGTFCTDFALRGYVAATIDYRLGIEAPKSVTTGLEAILRGVQDAKAAVRFFRAKGKDYGIDTAQIYIEGSSAGSMIAVHYAYWNDDEIPAEVNRAKWGNLEGTSGNPGYSSGIKGIMNYCGAIMNPKWIDAGELPVANFHGLLDQIVPPDSGVSTDFGFKLFGGVAIYRIATQLGIYTQGAFFPFMAHGGNEDSLRVYSSNFFYTLMSLASTAPKNFTSMALSARSLNVFRYDNYTCITTALDAAMNRVILPSSWVQYSCDPKIGSILPSGVFTPGSRPDSGYVYVQFNGRRDSCYIKTYDLKYIAITPKLSVTDLIQKIQISVGAFDIYSAKHDLGITTFTLSSTDPSVGTIDQNGIFTGKKNGTTKIIASFNSFRDTSIVRVESANGTVSLDLLESLSGWTITGEGMDSLGVTLATDQKSGGTSSFKIDYKATYDPLKASYMVYLNKDMAIYGIPDSIFLDVKSDGRRHRLFYNIADVDSEYYRASGKKYLSDSTVFSVIDAPMKGLSPVAGATGITYPLTLKRIELQIAVDKVEGTVTRGTIYVDNLRLSYPAGVTNVEASLRVPEAFSLEQNFPNPFNPSTIIRYELPARSRVAITIFNVLGQQIAELINTEQSSGSHETVWNARAATGLYFYRIEAVSASDPDRHFTQVRKMLLLK
jgi:dienelactone hydrolase